MQEHKWLKRSLHTELYLLFLGSKEQLYLKVTLIECAQVQNKYPLALHKMLKRMLFKLLCTISVSRLEQKYNYERQSKVRESEKEMYIL